MIISKSIFHTTRNSLVAIAGISLMVSLFSSDFAYATCATQDTSRGQVTYNVNITASGTYRVWSRIKASSSTNNSFILEIDGTTCGVVVGDSSGISSSAWTWVDYKSANTGSPIDVSLGVGSHSIKMIGREDAVSVDRIILTGDTSCVPTGNGDNCATASTDQSGSSDSSGSSQNGGSNSGGTSGGGTVYVKPSSTPVSVNSGTDIVFSAPESPENGSIVKTSYYLDGKLVITISKSPFTYKLDTKKLSSGKHVLTVKVTYSDGTTKTTTQQLNIKNASVKKSNTTAFSGVIIVLIIITGLGVYFQRKRMSKQPVIANQTTNVSTPSNHNQPIPQDQDAVVIQPTEKK